MHNNYASFLDYRAAQRRLAAKFAQPRPLAFHTLIFVVIMTAIWMYGMVWNLWFYQGNFGLPVFIALAWSALLALHAVLHYRRSPAVAEPRELAVEDEMRQMAEKSRDPLDDETLFALHRGLEGELERQGRWSLALLAFALLNVVSWVASAINLGTSFAFQMTLPLAVLVVGGVNVFLAWQQQRHADRAGWFARLPLRHIVAYAGGSIGLELAALFRLINPWDADNVVIVWGIVLLVHIIWAVAVWPAVRQVLPGRSQAEQPAKRKTGARLVLADDGEVLNIADSDAEHLHAHSS